ncbi:DUF4282 domain-containing protein [Actinomadura nitritigenes]|uniref:DUF4282 domain-containing protein n=2 Tax=Actinomadura nitritigenes TaxID=134602 RepID=A0ABS3R3Y2_9ACTN|nr:DUF4282 domain-containing protein [Actinomadura nitritigenes]MBO2440304.1 DUF4282 domain-containing protein [Actinomadura nitritigenes]
MMPPDEYNHAPHRPGLFAALVDVKFERAVTPLLVRWIYLGALVMVGFGIIFGLLWVWSLATWMGVALWLAAPIVLGAGLVTLLTVRIACEWTLTRFQHAWPSQPQTAIPQDSTAFAPHTFAHNPDWATASTTTVRGQADPGHRAGHGPSTGSGASAP